VQQEVKMPSFKTGDSAEFSKTITEADIVLYAGITGDTNPLHLNAEYAAGTRFGERIAHGMLTAGLISAVIGTKLLGPGAIYMSQTLDFKGPVHMVTPLLRPARSLTTMARGDRWRCSLHARISEVKQF
jgi:3-hydroxybutyryl-CoA dehydratase